MKFRFLTLSLMLVFTAFSFNTFVQTADEPHKINIFELFERKNDEDDDDDE